MSAINANLPAITAAVTLDRNQDLLGRSLNRLSTGSRIVAPSDDAAGLAVSSKLNAQLLRIQAAQTTIQNATSLTQAADGFMSSLSGMLTRMGELAAMAGDPTKNPDDVALYQQEFTELQQQLRQTVGGTTGQIGGTSDVNPPLGEFNGIALFGNDASADGSGPGLRIPVGADPGEVMIVPQANFRDGAMGAMIAQDGSGNFLVTLDSSDVTSSITSALQDVATERATTGGATSRLGLASSTLQVQSENLSSAVSRIRDVDVATESTQLARYNILVQSGAAMLVQANEAPQAVLKLLNS